MTCAKVRAYHCLNYVCNMHEILYREVLHKLVTFKSIYHTAYNYFPAHMHGWPYSLCQTWNQHELIMVSNTVVWYQCCGVHYDHCKCTHSSMTTREHSHTTVWFIETQHQQVGGYSCTLEYCKGCRTRYQSKSWCWSLAWINEPHGLHSLPFLLVYTPSLNTCYSLCLGL